MTTPTLTAAVGALIVALVAVRFVLFCLDDIDQRPVRYLSKPAWRLVVCFCIPFGAMLYFALERDNSRR